LCEAGLNPGTDVPLQVALAAQDQLLSVNILACNNERTPAGVGGGGLNSNFQAGGWYSHVLRQEEIFINEFGRQRGCSPPPRLIMNSHPVKIP
jgi:hypothetical protein